MKVPHKITYYCRADGNQYPITEKYGVYFVNGEAYLTITACVNSIDRMVTPTVITSIPRTKSTTNLHLSDEESALVLPGHEKIT